MAAHTGDDLTIHLPDAGTKGLDQDEEFFEIEAGSERRQIRFHDYGEIFDVPGLYERLFAERLQCSSPEVVVGLLEESLIAEGEDARDLRVVDLGAGNGLVGEQLEQIGVEEIVGIDMLDEARQAAVRDRPGVYDSYHVLDITDPEPESRDELEQHDFNCMTCVAALGFGDMPPEAFRAAFDLVGARGWLAFNIRDQFIDEPSAFSRLIDGMLEDEEMVAHQRVRYPHRLSVDGEPIEYVGVVAQKGASD